MQLLRSALFNAIMFSSVAVYAPLVLLTAPLPFSIRYPVITRWARFHMWLARHLLGIDYRVEGAENLPSGPAVVLAKHQSTWETLAFQQILPPCTWILKRELLWIPLFGWALALMRPVAIDRSAGKRAVEQIVQEGRRRLEQGVWIVVFPEGTRVAPGQRIRYKIGGAVLAVETGYPVVPIAHNAGRLWPRRGFLKKPGTVRVVIGPTIRSEGKSATQLLQEVEQWIEGTMDRIDPPDAQNSRSGVTSIR